MLDARFCGAAHLTDWSLGYVAAAAGTASPFLTTLRSAGNGRASHQGQGAATHAGSLSSLRPYAREQAAAVSRGGLERGAGRGGIAQDQARGQCAPDQHDGDAFFLQSDL